MVATVKGAAKGLKAKGVETLKRQNEAYLGQGERPREPDDVAKPIPRLAGTLAPPAQKFYSLVPI